MPDGEIWIFLTEKAEVAAEGLTVDDLRCDPQILAYRGLHASGLTSPSWAVNIIWVYLPEDPKDDHSIRWEELPRMVLTTG